MRGAHAWSTCQIHMAQASTCGSADYCSHQSPGPRSSALAASPCAGHTPHSGATLHNSAQQDTAGLPARNGGATKQKPSVIDEGLLQTFSRQKQPKDSLLFLAYFLALAALSSLGASVLGAAAASGAAGASGASSSLPRAFRSGGSNTAWRASASCPSPL